MIRSGFWRFASLAGLGMVWMTGLFQPSASALAAGSEGIKAFVECVIPEGPQVVDVSRRGSSAGKHRTVQTAEGEKQVSVTDGYRVLFAFPGLDYPFADVKVEVSNKKEYAQDKAAVIANFKHLTSSSAGAKFSDRTEYNGFESYGLDRTAIDVGQQIAIHSLFSDADSIIVTVYFPNQGPKGRKFSSIEEFHALRTKFLEGYSRCIAR